MHRFFLTACFSLFAVCAQAATLGVPFLDDSTRRESVLQLNNATTSDFLIAWAKAGNFNVIADATQVDSKGATILGEQKGQLGQLLLNFAAEHKINGRRYDERTFLLWRIVPDVRALASLIITHDGNTRGTVPPLTQEAMNALLAEYFQRVHGWDGKSAEIDVTVKIADLPPELREQVMHEVRDTLSAERRLTYVWFSDDLWAKARLHLHPGQELGHDAVMVISAALTRNFYGTQKIFYEERGVLYPDLLRPKTFESSKVFRVEPRPQVVEPVLQPNVEAKLPLVKTLPLLSQAQLQDDTDLQTLISLENQQLALSDFLSELQKQSGLAFSLAPEAAATTQLLLRVDKMPLWKVLNSLSQLYGFGWEKTAEGGYVLQNNALDKLDKQLLRISRFETFPLFATPQQSQEARQEVTHYLDDLFDSIDVDEASRDAGIPFSELNAEVQEKIRTRFEKSLASTLVRDYQATEEKLSEDLTLSFRAIPAKPPLEFVEVAPGVAKAKTAAPTAKPLEFSDLFLSVHLPVDSPYTQKLPAQVEPDLAERQFRGTMIARIFPTFPTGQNPDPRSPDGAKRAFERMQQQMKANREAQQNQQTQPVR